MQCPKCNASMHEVEVETLQGKVVIDKCDRCGGLGFANGEAAQPTSKSLAVVIARSYPEVGQH